VAECLCLRLLSLVWPSWAPRHQCHSPGLVGRTARIGTSLCSLKFKAAKLTISLLVQLIYSGSFTFWCNCLNQKTRESGVGALCDKIAGHTEKRMDPNPLRTSYEQTYVSSAIPYLSLIGFRCQTDAFRLPECSVQADTDLDGPKVFTDANCKAIYGQDFKGTCYMDGLYSSCPGPNGCSPPAQSPWPHCATAPANMDFKCNLGYPAYPVCTTDGVILCDLAQGYCVFGKCQCRTDGTFDILSLGKPTCMTL